MILEQLSNVVGVSGKEDAVRSVVLDAIKTHTEQIRIDPLGSITAVKKANNGANDAPLRVLVAAHMDEIGFMITGYDGDGLLRFTNIGGIDDRILPGLRIKIGDNGIPGVIDWVPIHKNNEQNVVKLSNLRIDIGASNKDEASGKVKRGDRATFDTRFSMMGEKMMRGKAFDDRGGCSLLVDVLEGESYPVEILAAFTVQEEIGLRGAQVVAQTLKPDFAVILEGTTAHDLPNPTADADESEDEWRPNPTSRVGGGPVISFMDRSLIVNPRLIAFLRETAEAEGIPYQYKLQLGGGTDGGAIHTSNEGVPTLVISLPCRYVHSPAALLHRDDYDATLRLVQAVLRRLSPAFVRSLYEG